MASFNDLPFEIRAQIWALTFEPRLVPVRIKFETIVSGASKTVIRHLISSTPVPKTLQICRESRSQSFIFYEKFFVSNETEAAYVWVNLNLDIIDIGEEWDYSNYKGYGYRIRRLKFEADNISESWYFGTANELNVFDNLVQCFVVAQDGWTGWVDAYNEHYFSCKPENLLIIDKDKRRMMSFPELERWWENEGYNRDEEAGVPMPYDTALALVRVKA